MVKTGVISLLGEEGRNERDQIAFCSFNSFLLLSPSQSPLCIAGRAGERGKESARGRPPRAFCFSILLGCPVGAYAEERVLSGSLNECWPHTCDACVLKNNLEIRIGGSYRRPELFFWAIYRFNFCNKKLLANPRSPTFLVRGIRQVKYPVKKFN